ncbi:hypothetical protein QOT17_014175 [Balamuthia mandrillaris]
MAEQREDQNNKEGPQEAGWWWKPTQASSCRVFAHPCKALHRELSDLANYEDLWPNDGFDCDYDEEEGHLEVQPESSSLPYLISNLQTRTAVMVDEEDGTERRRKVISSQWSGLQKGRVEWSFEEKEGGSSCEVCHTSDLRPTTALARLLSNVVDYSGQQEEMLDGVLDGLERQMLRKNR